MHCINYKMYDNNIISYIIVNSGIMPFNNGCTIACRKLTTNVCTNYGEINRCTYTALAFITWHLLECALYAVQFKII